MANRFLKINLTSGEIVFDSFPAEYVAEYIGGSSLAARLLWDMLDAQRDPLDPDSPLLWITGPLTGTGGPTTGRFTICGRSPQTGLWGESNIGGFVGPELRYAGIDALLITGRAPTPVYISIQNQRVEIRAADHIWGHADIYETQAIIRDELEEPRTRIAAIGVAGENRIKFSGIFSDHGRAAARTGMGALMGSKNIKALAVRGTGKIPLANAENYQALRTAVNKELIDHNMTAVYRATGTSGAADYLQIVGDMPQKYWTQATFEGAEKIGGAEMAETILVGTSACQGCVISCGRVVNIQEGGYATHKKVKGPEYETICAFGSQLLIDDLAAITALGDLCDRLGMDSITAGSMIGLAYYLFDQGILTTEDTGGLALVWGDPQPCFTLLNQMARREGLGARMADGSRAFARSFGVEELAVQVNGLDIAMHDPRAFSGQTLSYLTSPRGACHNQSDFFSVELGGTIEELGLPMVDAHTDAGKAALVARHQHWRTVANSLVYCFFAVVPPAEIINLLSEASGHLWTLSEVMKAGERAWNLKRIHNLRYGLTPKSEKLPKLLLQSLPDGGQDGHVPDVELLLGEYYAASSWDRETGWPTQAKFN